MADFAPGLDPRSSINHFDNGSVMVVEWRNVRLQNDSRGASFTFQVSLHRSGTIVFAYRQVPVPIASLATARHPVRVGLSDAFTVTPPDAARPGWSRRVLYEYERVMLDVSLVRSGAAIQFLPLPMCQQLRSCAECVSARIGFHCFWCHGVGRCSHGLLDRYRQEWVHAGCPEKTHGDICGEDPEGNLTSTAPGTRGGATTAPSGVSLGEGRRRELEEATPSAGPPQGGPRAGGLVTVLGTLAVLLLLVVAATRWARRPPGGDERLTGLAEVELTFSTRRNVSRTPPGKEIFRRLTVAETALQMTAMMEVPPLSSSTH
ncbi:plexin domain-containing protein 1-like isoform X3 [Lethenteron reissneri]|uniref:plexin domain-containing protein 1-like isoform X3 n=1 Tax=Lethenteron reissneri TaxID=7753 RepID=UPI002AB74CF1|nr:plexin domain-containing protein 1-like isoform X3 [Lethenteron reissneri]